MKSAEFMSVIDAVGFFMSYKELSYRFYSYLHRKSVGKEARRLSAKIASDENNAVMHMKKITETFEKRYEDTEKSIIETLYLSILDEPIIPMHKKQWKGISKNLKTYRDVLDVYLRFFEELTKFLTKIRNNLKKADTQKVLSILMSKEEFYKEKLKQTVGGIEILS